MESAFALCGRGRMTRFSRAGREQARLLRPWDRLVAPEVPMRPLNYPFQLRRGYRWNLTAGLLFETSLQLLGDRSNLWFQKNVLVIALNFTDLQSANRVGIPSRARVAQLPERFVTRPEQNDPPRIRSRRIAALGLQTGRSDFLDVIRQPGDVPPSFYHSNWHGDHSREITPPLRCWSPEERAQGGRGGCSLLRKRSARFRKIGVKQYDHRRVSLPLSCQLLSHFESDHAAKRVPSQKIRPVRLNPAYFLDVVRRHVFSSRVQYLSRFQSIRLQSIERLVWAKASRQVVKPDHRSINPVDTEERRL